MASPETSLLLEQRKRLYEIRTQLWESVPPGELNVVLYCGLGQVAVKVESGEIEIETVKANLRKMRSEKASA